MNQLPRQTPTRDEVYLDHVGWFVRNIDAAGSTFERLGFCLTPLSIQRTADSSDGPPSLTGLANRCAMLRRGYLEILGTTGAADTPLSRQHRAAVRRYIGAHLVAFSVPSAAEAYVRLRDAGFDPLPPVRLRRPLQSSNGTEAEAAFTVIRVRPGKMIEGRIQLLTHETPKLVWQPRFISWENGFTALTAALMCVDDPREAADRFGRFVGRTPVHGNGYSVLHLDRGLLGFATPARSDALLPGIRLSRPPMIAAIAVLAVDPALSRRFLTARGIPLTSTGDGSMCVHPRATMGTALVIHGLDESWPPSPVT